MQNQLSPLVVPQRLTRAAVIEHLAMPFLLFSAILAGLLFLSWLLLLPLWARVDVNGQLYNASQLSGKQAELTAGIQALQTRRDAALLPVHDAAYIALRDARQVQPDMSLVFEKVRQAAASVSPVPGAIRFNEVSFSAADHTLVLAGDVRSVGFRSMTVLAQLVDAIGALDGVTHVELPRFVRMNDAATGMHSPFSFTVTLP
ncbi:MAG: hypothetical protein JWM56_486 [Candidatus Peribacteria bacterium]|nr:hypothetical protein [Candidatus Peribacteria bacterium]